MEQLAAQWGCLWDAPAETLVSSDALSRMTEDVWRLVHGCCLDQQWKHPRIRAMQRMITVMIGFLFPISLVTHRHDDEMELFLATVLTAQGILQLRERRHTRWARKIIYMTVSPVHTMLAAQDLSNDMVQRGIEYVRQSLENTCSGGGGGDVCSFFHRHDLCGQGFARTSKREARHKK